uniref:Ig-like domain-containing protein n=1 Tax=Calidris pygmaea TaxID=425635 RepID=A0A8C3PTS6_9CHAR
MYLPVIQGDAVDWPSIRPPASLGNPRAWPQMSRVLAIAWGWRPLDLRLTLPAGGSATFFCNISMENDSGSEYSLNWYKEINHSQPQKIAEISRNKPQTKTEKYLLTNHTPAFKIEILNLHQNDSGSYYCGLITFFEPDKVVESTRSHLVVTGHALGHSHPSWSPQALYFWFLLANAIPGLCIFLLSISLALLGCFRAGFGTLCKKRTCKEEKPPVVSVSTVDYGVLEFQRDQCTQVPAETKPVDQTEYATIVFPEEKPITPERGKKHQDERTWQLQPC